MVTKKKWGLRGGNEGESRAKIMEGSVVEAFVDFHYLCSSVGSVRRRRTRQRICAKGGIDGIAGREESGGDIGMRRSCGR